MAQCPKFVIQRSEATWESRSTMLDRGKAIGETVTAFPRLPRRLRLLAMTIRGGRCRFGDSPYESFVQRRERHAAPLQWLVRSAKCHQTYKPRRDRFRFNGSRYESAVPSRDCRVASLLAMTIRGPVPFYRQPVPTVSSAPGGACPSPTTRDWKLRVTLHYPLSIFHLHHAAPTTTALIRIGGGGHFLYICLTGARTSCSCGAGGGPAPP